VGQDNWDEQSAQARRGHDGVVDGIGFNSQTRGWVDHANGTLVLPDLRPFAPRLAAPGGRPFDQYLDAQLNRRIRLDGPPDVLNRPNPGAYERFNPLPKDAQWYFTAEFAAARSGGGDITLGRGNILDNSEAVVVNGERWVRDRDYTIDYDLGRLTLKRQLGPSDQLSVDYSYAPLFAQASKTLIGSAFRLEGRDRSLGGAFLYESKGAQDLRPRLGEEPSRTLITDLNTEWRFRPSFLTRLANAMPATKSSWTTWRACATPSRCRSRPTGGAGPACRGARPRWCWGTRSRPSRS
jgi:cell surface protein SprA